MNLFTYGTLEVPAVMTAVTKRTFPAVDAVLPGYARFLVDGRVFPGIIARPGAKTDGVLYEEVDANAMAMLDAYESFFYTRTEVCVITTDNRKVMAWAYVISPGEEHRLSSIPWDRQTFIHSHLERYLG
jgi:gamma-glutamylcyclotransferase (GGCT)/AIG2-like uncharacterized protein YtfP